MDQHAGKCEALLLAAGQERAPLVRFVETRNEMFEGRSARGCREFSSGPLARGGDEQGGAQRTKRKIRALRHEGDVAPAAQDFAASPRPQSGHRMNERALPLPDSPFTRTFSPGEMIISASSIISLPSCNAMLS